MTDTPDIETLGRLAEAAIPEPLPDDARIGDILHASKERAPAIQAFRNACTPQAILSLCARVRELEDDFKTMESVAISERGCRHKAEEQNAVLEGLLTRAQDYVEYAMDPEDPAAGKLFIEISAALGKDEDNG